MDKNLEKQIDEILTRGVGEFIDPDNVFRKKLIAKKEGNYPGEIIIKYGVDPTRPDIHLGHAVCFRKLRQLQDLGCKIVFLIGDFTAQIGDPTGKSKVRPEIEQESVENNLGTYLDQIENIVNVGKDGNGKIKINSNEFSWIRNSDWYTDITDIFAPPFFPWVKVKNDAVNKAKAWNQTRMQNVIIKDRIDRGDKGVEGIKNVTLRTFISVLRSITHAQLLDRSMFKERIKSGKDLFMHEVMYPALQGIDSNVIYRIYGSCDIEVGGTDQIFNMLIGRDIMEFEKQKPQSVLALRLLEGTDGKEKMSKSLDNYIGITEEPNQMFGKVMSIPDSSIINYFELCTDVPMDEIEETEKEMKDGKLNPRDAKLKLAGEITTIYHGEDDAREAREYFINTFSKKEIPQEVAEFIVENESIKLVDLLVKSGNATSTSDARRKIEQGGVSVDDEKITDTQSSITKEMNGKVLKIGKLGFVKIKF